MQQLAPLSLFRRIRKVGAKSGPDVREGYRSPDFDWPIYLTVGSLGLHVMVREKFGESLDR